jgi:hypothetical protein
MIVFLNKLLLNLSYLNNYSNKFVRIYLRINYEYYSDNIRIIDLLFEYTF